MPCHLCRRRRHKRLTESVGFCFGALLHKTHHPPRIHHFLASVGSDYCFGIGAGQMRATTRPVGLKPGRQARQLAFGPCLRALSGRVNSVTSHTPVADAAPRVPAPRWVRKLKPGLNVVVRAHSAIPPAQGLFDPSNDKDACGVGFVGELSKQPSRKCVTEAMEMLGRMTHRGACGCEANTGK